MLHVLIGLRIKWTDEELEQLKTKGSSLSHLGISLVAFGVAALVLAWLGVENVWVIRLVLGFLGLTVAINAWGVIPLVVAGPVWLVAWLVERIGNRRRWRR